MHFHTRAAFKVKGVLATYLSLIDTSCIAKTAMLLQMLCKTASVTQIEETD